MQLLASAGISPSRIVISNTIAKGNPALGDNCKVVRIQKIVKDVCDLIQFDPNLDIPAFWNYIGIERDVPQMEQFLKGPK